MRVKFTGRFKDLIPDGWTFQKLFARNYRQYHKTFDGKQHSQGCRIWQHLGGYLEIADLYDRSYFLVKQIEDGKIEEWKHEIHGKTYYWLIFDRDENVIHACPSPEYCSIKQEEYETGDSDGYYERYLKINLRPKMVDMIQNLVDKGWIKSELGKDNES